MATTSVHAASSFVFGSPNHVLTVLGTKEDWPTSLYATGTTSSAGIMQLSA